MKGKVYIANAFAKEKFGGNPAAVVPGEAWLPDDLLQKIAAQNNLSETAYIIPQGKDYAIRWFTPAVEVDLCGHATLAAAHVLWQHLGYPGDRIIFNSRSGPLHVTGGKGGGMTLDFPVDEPVESPDSGALEKALGIRPRVVYKSRFDFMAVLARQSEIEMLKPDLAIVKTLSARGLIVTAPGDNVDFVSRCFFPQSGIDEDPVTGSAHCVMVPYWAKQTGRNKLSAIQLSLRRGYLACELAGDRVLMSGQAHTYLEGEFYY